MSGYVEQGEVVRNEQIGSDVWIMDIHAPKQAAEAKVGQFCNVRVANSTAPLLRRPISYAGCTKGDYYSFVSRRRQGD